MKTNNRGFGHWEGHYKKSFYLYRTDCRFMKWFVENVSSFSRFIVSAMLYIVPSLYLYIIIITGSKEYRLQEPSC